MQSAITQRLIVICIVIDVAFAELKKFVERITLKERTINKDFDNLGAEFRQRQHEFDDLSRRVDELNRVCATSLSQYCCLCSNQLALLIQLDPLLHCTSLATTGCIGAHFRVVFQVG
jgi:hypothetical protein